MSAFGTGESSSDAELGGFGHYTWVTTAYLVTSAVAVPIAGKLSDQLGRKPLLIGSMIAFLLTSLLCAQAQTFNELVGARAVQGLSGGAITAALFIKEFTGDLPWVHVDIAGTAWAEEAKPYQPKGATGVGVRTLVELARDVGSWHVLDERC